MRIVRHILFLLGIGFVCSSCAEGSRRRAVPGRDGSMAADSLVATDSGDDGSPTRDGFVPDFGADARVNDTGTGDTSLSPDTGPLPHDVGPRDVGRPDVGRPDGGRDAGSDSGPVCDAPCRLLSPQCGCGSATCYFDQAAEARVCLAAGSIGEGESCSSAGDCSEGLVCHGAAGGQWCRRLCSEDVDCGGGQSICHAPSSGPRGHALPIKICSVPCDPLAQTGCPDGAACTILLTFESAEPFTHCRVAGAAVAGTNCVHESECLGGLVCAVDCTSICDQNAPVCAAGESCERLATINGVAYGKCTR